MKVRTVFLHIWFGSANWVGSGMGRRLGSYNGCPRPVAIIVKQEPWYRWTPQSMMEIRLISLDERHEITNKFEKVLSRTKEKFNTQFYSSIMSPKDYNQRGIYRPQTF